MEMEDVMSAVKAIWKDGHVGLEGHADWPEGHRLVVVDETELEDDNQADDPESIARWISAVDATPPLEMTAEEEAKWQEARQAQRDLDRATFNERAEKLRRMFE
jgi:hypothetical protein